MSWEKKNNQNNFKKSNQIKLSLGPVIVKNMRKFFSTVIFVVRLTLMVCQSVC